ncbi:MAG: methyltransferase domain-containing protein [Deltaproteobacteria bacterium]|nr:methyltransferase domain-containing protein [Deltaproteobacteria bacterium]
MDLTAQIYQYVVAHYLPPRLQKRPLQALAKGAALVSAAFTSERRTLPIHYFNRPDYRSGYLLYFVAVNLPKILHCLSMSHIAARLLRQPSLRVLDLGCGPGTGALAMAAWWQGHHQQGTLTILGVDQNRKILEDARNLMARCFPQVSHTTVPRTITANTLPSLRGGPFDVILCANLLNEIPSERERLGLVSTLVQQHLTDHGISLILEPALRQPTRALMVLHDQLLAPHTTPHTDPRSPRSPRSLARIPHILAPCLHQAACPMLRPSRRDWCHAYLDWERPPLIAKLDHLIGNRKEYLKFSYLILSNRGSETSRLNQHLPQYRVVSAPLRSKGKTELLLCPATAAPEALTRLTRLDRDRSSANAEFDRVLRGDIVETMATTRLTADTDFRIIQSFRVL